ncbi:enolase C-terminal domain-like protein [Streptomyces sp. NPDC014779]|uniref:enolase C-terminal domain-like protein n=1 Tax=Streptomyces sp. NPDC014779 TaxID=3364911 RepID=UPI0036FB7259
MTATDPTPARVPADTPVTGVDATAYTVPTDRPEADGTFAWDATTAVVVEVRAERATGTGWTYAPAATAAVVRELLAPVVSGGDALAVPALHRAMVRALRNAGRPGIAACALSAVDIALWDLKARLLGLPLATLLGTVRTDVPLYGSGGFVTDSDARLTARLDSWVHGCHIPRVKIKTGQDRGTATGRDLARVRLAREVIGPDAELYVDANGAYTRKQAVRIGRELAAHDVVWFEEPVSSDDLTGLRLVRDRLDCDVAAGEYGYDPPYFARMLTAGAVDCLQADATRCGGITGWLRAAALADAHGLGLSAHCAPHVHAHPAASAPALRHIEWFEDHARLEPLLFEGEGLLDPAGGTVRPAASGAPGLGLALRKQAAASYRTA